MERTVRIQATRAMKVAWSIPYTRTTISKTFRDGEWSAPTISTGSFTFGVGDTFSNAVTMDLSSTSATGGAVALRLGRKRANASTTAWTNTLFTSAEAVEWLTIDKIATASTNPNTDTDRDGVLNVLEDRMGTKKEIRNSDGTGYADGDQINQQLLPSTVRFITSTRNSEYEFSPEDPRCPYHPANRIEMETDTPPESDVNDDLGARIGLEDGLHNRLAAGAPFPQTPPSSQGIPQLNEDGTSADLPSDPSATVGYTDKPDGNNTANSTEAADGNQRRVWLGIPEALSYDTTYNLIVTRTVTRQNGNGTPLISAPTATLITRTIPAGSTTTSASVELLAKKSPGGTAEHVTAQEKASLPGIEPDTGMAGVLGDTIPSINQGSSIKHFVTPKKLAGANDPADLKAGYVILKATGITAEQITPGHAKQTMLWDPNVGEAVPGEPLKWQVKRDALTGARHEVKIKMKTGGATAAQMNVWVVWSTCIVTPGTAQFVLDPVVPRYLITPTASTVWRFKFKILPADIIAPANTERPDLMGDRSGRHPPPGHKTRFVVEPSLGVADTAKLKWDVSRQQQVRILNPSLISQSDLQLCLEPDEWYASQPNANIVAVPYPSSHVEGNDDAEQVPRDEDTNPYIAVSGGGVGLDHAVGEMTSVDRPNFAVNNHLMSPFPQPDGKLFSIQSNFREFARVQLWDGSREGGAFWLRISDFHDWHHYLSAKFHVPPSEWRDNISRSGIGHPTP